jgi:fructose-1,6-bisphosphatase I
MMDLSPLYDTFKQISLKLRQDDIIDLGTDTQFSNTSLDIQKEIDFYSNELIKQAVNEIPEIIGFISEEDKSVVFTDTEVQKGYLLIFDPLDGSKNVYSNITCGTIYGIYEYDKLTDTLLSIYESGYCLYGPSTILVHTTPSKTVEQFQLMISDEFEFKRELVLPTKNTMYCINMSYNFDTDIQTLLRVIKNDGCTQRWCGALVADCHQMVMRGGTFIYPETDKNPNGKIRLLYEAIPMAHIITTLGGLAIDGNHQNIMDKLQYTKLNNKSVHREISLILSTFYSASDLRNSLDINDMIKC